MIPDLKLRTATAFLFLYYAAAIGGAENPQNSDWPQFRGPNRDGVALNSPKLMNTWPKEGPPLVWKSDWIQGSLDGGCGHPVVAGGKVFVYSNAKLPPDGGDGYRYVTTEVLVDYGWLPDLPEELAKKIEAAWASANRPPSDWRWSDLERSAKEDFNAYLQKKPELDKYIKDFLALLPAQDAEKYGDYIRKRLGKKGGVPWETLVKLSSLRETRYRSSIAWFPVLLGYKPFSELYVNSGRSLASPTIRRLTRLADSIVCLDAATGKTLWRKDFPIDWQVVVKAHYDQWCMFGGTGVNSTPAVVGDKCYVSGILGVYCLSVKDGALVWHTEAPPVNSFILVADGVVYESGNGSAYSADTGALLWKNPFYPGKGGSGTVNWHRWNTPLLWSTGGKKYIISTDGSNGFFCCLDLQTGKALWTEKAAVGWFPTLRGDSLMISTPWPHGSDGVPAKLAGPKLYKLTLAGPELIWKGHFADTDGDLIYQDHLYMYAGCVDLKTGEVNWRTKNSGGIIAPPIVADGKLIQLAESPGEIDEPSYRVKFLQRGFPIVMLKATPEKFVKLGEFFTQACSMCSPAISDGKMFLRLHDSVACYDLREHGVYLDGVTAAKDKLTFRFKQTGGGLVAKDATGGVMITDASGAAKPIPATVAGDDVVVDISGVSAPFGISCAAGALAGKNGLPVPAFDWNSARTLKIRKCVDRNIILESSLPLLPEGNWNRVGTYTVSGAKITDVTIDSKLRAVTLITDKIWKAGETFNLTYASFPVEKGDPRRETLQWAVVEPQRPAAKFVKMDESTSGNWKGVYGKDGAVIAGDKTSAAPPYAVVTVTKAQETPQGPSDGKDVRFLQKSGEAQNRTVQLFNSYDLFDIAINVTDGKEHQVAAYCFPWGATMALEVLNPDTGAVLDSQTVEYKDKKSKYLVWNIKGSVILRFIRTDKGEFSNAAIGGVFFDPAGTTTK